MASETFGVESPTETDTKTRRILEVQSDLFQKGRDKDFLTNRNEYIEEGRMFDGNYIYDKFSKSSTGFIKLDTKTGKEVEISKEEYYKIANKKGFLNDNPNQFLQLLI